VSQADIGKITVWMRSQGFDIITVGRGRRFVAFNATIQQIQNSLKTEIRQYQVGGELHYANSSEPSVPEAIQPLVAGILGLDDMGPKAANRARTAKPNITLSPNSYAISPGDLAVIYNVDPIYKAGITGGGLPLAVIGQSNIELSDIEAFHALFGVPHNAPKLILVPGANDPGLVMNDEGESDLDIEESGGIAPDAQVIFVYSPNVDTSVMWAIDQDLAQVISFSYSACEPDASSADVSQYQALAQQANAQGITWIVSAGDDGACDARLGRQPRSGRSGDYWRGRNDVSQ
jgi:subtilase family serine protease